MPSSLNLLNILFLNSCWTKFWSSNSLTWQVKVKSRELSPKPGMNLANGGGSAKEAGNLPDPPPDLLQEDLFNPFRVRGIADADGD